MTEENAKNTESTGQSKDEKNLAAFLKSDRVPSNEIEVTINYDPDDKGKYKTCVFRFTRNIDAYDRYMSGTFVKAARGESPHVIASSRQFILDMVDPSQSELIAGFLDAYPSEAPVIATRLCDAYEVPGGMEELKNG